MATRVLIMRIRASTHKKVLGETVWQMSAYLACLAKRFGKCRRVWRVSLVHVYVCTGQTAHDKACHVMHKKHILYV
jgi:hypothetical protein